MLRIHFTGADLERVRVRTRPHPMWEMLLSVHRLQEGIGAAEGPRWPRWTGGPLLRLAKPMLEMTWPIGYSADFLTPHMGGTDIRVGVQAMLGTDETRLAGDISELARARPLGPVATAIGNGDREALHRLGTAVVAYYAACVEPRQDRIEAIVRADAERRTRIATVYGVDRLLATLHPAVRWRRPVLDVDYPAERVLHLNGRGIELVPSYFCGSNPITLREPALPPVLVYPALRDLPAETGSDPVALLIGRTRATILRAVRVGATTMELAAQLDISPANVSHHVTVLRNAGLVRTHGIGTTRVHSLTALGAAMLTR